MESTVDACISIKLRNPVMNEYVLYQPCITSWSIVLSHPTYLSFSQRLINYGGDSVSNYDLIANQSTPRHRTALLTVRHTQTARIPDWDFSFCFHGSRKREKKDCNNSREDVGCSFLHGLKLDWSLATHLTLLNNIYYFKRKTLMFLINTFNQNTCISNNLFWIHSYKKRFDRFTSFTLFTS